MQQVKADLVIIGGGSAGLAAAVTAAEKGAGVIVFEKSGHTGGTGNMASGLFAAESRMQRLKQLCLTREEAFKILMDWTHWRVDARLVRTYIDMSAGTIDWLEGLGVEFAPLSDMGTRSPQIYQTAHPVKGTADAARQTGRASVMMKVLAGKARELGVRVMLRTPVRQILAEGGRITGVTAEDESGGTVRAGAGAVIVGTGGFGDNPEWIKKYTGFEYGTDLFSTRVPGLKGDGIRMAWETGAGATGMNMHAFQSCGGRGHALQTTFAQPNLIVNLQGERFINEDIIARNNPYIANALMAQKKRCAFSIMDEAAKTHYVNSGWDFPITSVSSTPDTRATGLDAELEQSLKDDPPGVFAAGSLDELALKTGIDPAGLKKTAAEYNEACRTGRDGLFNRKPGYLRPVERPRFYAARLFIGAFGTLGGIRIDHKARVLTEDGDVIPGLYAAGTDANSINGDTYAPLAGNTLGFAINTGRLAGINAAEYVSGREVKI